MIVYDRCLECSVNIIEVSSKNSDLRYLTIIYWIINLEELYEEILLQKAEKLELVSRMFYFSVSNKFLEQPMPTVHFSKKIVLFLLELINKTFRYADDTKIKGWSSENEELTLF